MPDIARFVDEHRFRVGETDFFCDPSAREAPDGCLVVMKPRDLVEMYVELSRQLRPATIVELGIKRGGSTALLSELNQPDKLIAVELSQDPVEALLDYADRRGLTQVIRPYFGVDQSDRARLSAIVADELGGRPIDLVVDDASHLYQESRSSFETLFPLLAPDALFVVEDWNGHHLLGDTFMHILNDATAPGHDAVAHGLAEIYEAEMADPASRPVPLTQLALELVLARASFGDAIREVTINRHWIVVRRGGDVLDPDTFRLSDHFHDHVGLFARSTGPT